MTFTRIALIVVLTAAAFYFGLNYFYPHNHGEQKADGGATPDQVVGSSPAAAPSADAGASSSGAQTADAAASSSSSGAQTAGTAAMPASGSSSSSVEVAEAVPADNGDSNAPPAAADNGGSSSGTADTAQAAPAASTDSGASADASSGGSSSGSTEVAQATPASAGDSNSPAASASEAAPASSEPAAAAPEPKKKHPHAAAGTASNDSGTAASAKHARAAVVKKGHADEDEIGIWWPAVGQQNDSQLNLVYAGEAATEKAVVLLFSDNVDASTAGSHIELLTFSGKPASGQWTVSPQNPRMLVFKTRAPGRYLVILPRDLAGTSGKTLGAALHGPVYVH